MILVGFSHGSAGRFAEKVELAGHVTNPYGVRNEETKEHPDIFVCRGFKKSWPEFWENFQRFGWLFRKQVAPVSDQADDGASKNGSELRTGLTTC